jgi:hypothetical protein
MTSIDTDLPRPFRLLKELKGSSDYPGVSFGLEDPGDMEYKFWAGSFISSSGHFMNLTFICDDEFPKTISTIKFNESYMNQYPEDYDEDYAIILKNVQKLCNSDGTLKKNVIVWKPEKTIGSYLSELRKLIMK